MIEKQAPKGKFRVIGVDRLESALEHRLIGDYSSVNEALMVAHKNGATLNPVSVYCDEGNVLFSAGSYKVAQ
jgi:hypothetical protein